MFSIFLPNFGRRFCVILLEFDLSIAIYTQRSPMAAAFRGGGAFDGQMVRVDGLRNDTKYNGMCGIVFQSNPGNVSPNGGEIKKEIERKHE